MTIYEVSPDTTQVPATARQLIDGVRVELSEMITEMQGFSELEGDEVMRRLSAFHARAFELRSRLVRQSTNSLQALRTKEVEPFLEACEFQYKIHSRAGTFRQQEWEMTR